MVKNHDQVEQQQENERGKSRKTDVQERTNNKTSSPSAMRMTSRVNGIKRRGRTMTSQDDVMESNVSRNNLWKIMDTTSLGLGPFSRKRYQKFSV